MTITRTTDSKAARLKRAKPEYLSRHANGVYRVRIKVNGKSKERGANSVESAKLPGKQAR